MASSEDLNPNMIYQKERRLVQAVNENNVELLKVLLDSPKWYNTTDDGYNLLQIAIFEKKKEVFDYLLSLPDYPLEFENARGRTALEESLYNSWAREDEYFPCELIKKGACINKIYDRGNTILHCACKGGFLKASMLLIEKGIDVNACNFNNCTPLQIICKGTLHDVTEIVFMLLEFGADTSVRDENGYTPFENSVKFNHLIVVQEALFYYTFDEFSLLEIHFDILLKLASLNSPLFYEIIKHQFEIIVETNESTVEYFFNVLKYIELPNLKILITKFETTFQFFFAQFSEVKFDKYIGWISVDKLNIFIENNFKDQMINVIIPLMCPYLGSCIITFYYNVITCQNESKLTEYICFLLSYGMELYQPYLHCIYKKFQYCDLFKILLHMDIKEEAHLNNFDSISASLFINVTKTLENFLEVAESMSSSQLKELMCYFAHPKLHSMYRKAIFKESFSRKTISAKSIDVPKIPSLLELSRNVFRSCFINKYQIKTSSQFYTLLNCLEINPVYKTIITYETKLYKP